MVRPIIMLISIIAIALMKFSLLLPIYHGPSDFAIAVIVDLTFLLPLSQFNYIGLCDLSRSKKREKFNIGNINNLIIHEKFIRSLGAPI